MTLYNPLKFKACVNSVMLRENKDICLATESVEDTQQRYELSPTTQLSSFLEERGERKEFGVHSASFDGWRLELD